MTAAKIEHLHPAETDFAPEGPQPLLRPLPDAEPYPVDALGPLQAVVEAVADVTQAPVAIAAQSALAVASLAVQGFADVETLGGAAPCALFVLTIAESGERKSSCDRLLMAGVREHEAKGAISYRVDYAGWLSTAEIRETKRKRAVADAARGKDGAKTAAAQADLRTLGPKPPEPIHPNLTAADPTLEGLLRLFGIARPALGLFADEGGGFVGGHAMNADNRLKSLSGLSKLWDGDPIDRTRAGDGITTYRGRRLSLHLMLQPVAARPLMADPLALGQGFLARCLICEPTSHIGTRLRREHSQASVVAIAAFADRLTGILNRPLPTPDDPRELKLRLLPLSPAARKVLEEYGDAVEWEQAAGGKLEGVRAFASKSAEQAARIAGVLTLWADPGATEVTAATMAGAIALAQHYLGEALRLVEAATVTAVTQKAEALRRWCAKWPHKEVLPGEILQFGPNPLRERAALTAPLAALVEAGWLVPLPVETIVRGKPRKEAYRIVRVGE